MSDGDPDAIWRSDDVPVQTTPPQIRSRVTDRPPPDEISFDTLTVGHDDAPHEPAPSTKRTVAAIAAVVGAVVVVGVVVVGVVVNGRDDAAGPTATTPPASVAPPDSVGEGTDEPTGTDPVPGLTGAGVPAVSGRIELPPAVAAIAAPTEVLAVTQDGLLHTVSLPSGRLRTVDLDALSDTQDIGGYGGALAVAPDAAAVGSFGSAVVVVPRSGDVVDAPIETDPGGGLNLDGWVRADDGSTRFLVSSYSGGNGAAVLFAVGVDGTVTPLPAEVTDARFGSIAVPQGDLLVNDAGGAYRLGLDGTSRRVENGVVLAADGAHRFVRECDEVRQCSTAVVSELDGARRVVDPASIPDDFDQFGFSVALSPDGSAASWIRSGPTRQERVILDFEAGEVAAAPSETWTNGSTWAGDSSGVFDIAGGELHFIDRATGESVAFGRELGPLLTLGVRRPDAELPEPPPIVSAAVTPSEPIGATGLVLSAAPSNGGIGVLSIDSGELATWQSPPVGRGTTVLAPSADGVLVLPADGSPPFLTTPGSETTLPPDVAADGPLLVGPTDDTLWVPDDDAPRDTVRYRLLRLDGTVADDLGSATVDAPDATLLGGDGRGALVVLRRGDVFVVGVDGAARLTTGELIAIGPTTAYVRECESLDGCEVVRVDRVTQQRTPVSSGSGVLDGLTGVDTSRGAALGTTVSPDGEVLVSRVVAVDAAKDPTTAMALVDLAANELTFVDELENDQPVVWNVESTFAAVLVGPTISVYDRVAHRMVELDTVRLRAVGPAPRQP